MLSYKSKQRAILFIASIFSASLFFAFLILSGQAQQEVSGTTLLKEYFLPVQALAPIEEGSITVNGNECATAGSGDCVGHDVDAALGVGTDIDSTLGYKKSTEGLMIENNGVVTYKVTVADPNTYQLRITAKNATDSLDGITRSQYGTISSLVNAVYVGPETATEKELSFRHLRFQVSILKDGDTTPSRSVGTLSVNDRNEFSNDSVDLGSLQPGGYTISLEFINDLPNGIAYTGVGVTCGEELPSCQNFTICSKDLNDKSICALPASDNGDGKLDKTPIIKELKISKTTFTNDVLGVRIYTNPEHLSALDWYNQKLTNPGNAVPVVIDGYRGVLDGRTAYINAANIDSKGVFYTNIYVIAYNINASPATVQINNQVLSNWQFNVNLSSGLNELEKDRVKNQLRRDTARLEDVNVIRASLESYKLRNNKYPDLRAGTFVSGHALSSWPTWQSILGAQLSTSIPADPINQLAIESYPQGSSIASEPRQYDCTSDAEKNYCETVCTRTEDTNLPLTGCRVNQQCVDDQYCSLVPPGYDPVTGWNQTTQKLAFTDEAVTGSPATSFGLYDEGSINTNGSRVDTDGAFSKYKDDAFVYQYTAVNGGESYVFNYRLEYSAHCGLFDAAGNCLEFTAAKCANNQCYFEGNNTCVESGQALYATLKPTVAYNFNETSASTIIDQTGNTAFNGVTSFQINPDRIIRDTVTASQSLLFNGSEVMTANNITQGSTDNFTVATVLRPLVLPAVGNVATLVGTSTQRILALRTTASGTSLEFSPNVNLISTPTDYKILNGTSYHIVGTYAKNSENANFTETLYVNGIEVAKNVNATGQTYVINSLKIAENFNGSIDSFAIYDKALTVREIQDLYFGNDSYMFDKYRNTYCFAGLFVNSCGNGIVQMDAGEQCEPSVAGTNSNYCDATYGQHAWYNKSSVNPGCTTSCEAVTSSSVGQLPVPYNAQQPALSCGGYCGDNIVQFENREQCDQGSVGGAIAQPNRGGSGGIGPDSQYVCTGIVNPDISTVSFFEQSQSLVINSANLSPVRTVSGVVAMPANTTFTVSYTVGASSASPSNTIDVLLEELSGNNTLIAAHRKSFLISSTASADKLLTFTTRSSTAQARLTFSFSSDLSDVSATVSGISVNSVNGCVSYGGYCGDGSVQALYNEQCDILSYRTPTPAQTVNQLIDPSFERGLGVWKAVDGNQLPVSAGTAGRGTMSIESSNIQNIKSGDGSLVFQPSGNYIGVGQDVFFGGSPATENNTLQVSAWVKRIVIGSSPILKLRAYQYNVESGSLVNFTSGSFLEADLQANGVSTVTGEYQLFTSGTITIPKATTSNTNAVTFVAIVAVRDNTGATVSGQPVLFIDDVTLTSNYKIQYSCGKQGNQSCQLIGGTCGDSIIQRVNGEICDNGPLNGVNGATIVDGKINGISVSVSGTTYDQNDDDIADGFIQNGKAYSYCTSQCSQPFCGDGIKGVNGVTLSNELCDPTDPTDPQAAFCTNSCNQFKLGGSCDADNQCVSGTVCATVDTTKPNEKKCVLLPGQRGCFENTDCLMGLECNPLRHMCMVPLDSYLKYHGDPNGFPKTLVNTDSANKTTPAFQCPYTSIVSRLDIPVVLDGCTGLEFRNLDLPINTKVSHDQAADTCRTAGLGFALPAAKELYALVSPTTYTDVNGDGSSVMAPNNYLKLCSVNGLVTSKGGDDSCIEGNASENYLYWTDTRFEGKKACSRTSTTSCIQDSDCPFLITTDGKISNIRETCSLDLYYAVNFKKGSLEVYPENTLMRSRCVSTSSCGNGSIEGDEQCEFDSQGTEQLSGASCQEKGFAGGNAHCDPVSCRVRYDNCMVVAKPASVAGGTDGLTCENACNTIGEQAFQIKQCTDPNDRLLNAQGCVANSECGGTCQNGSCSNNPSVSCGDNAGCNFGTCELVKVTANESGVITSANAETFPSQINNTDYDVNFSAGVSVRNIDPNNSSCSVDLTGGAASVAGVSTAANSGICDLSIFGTANTSQVVNGALAPAALCTCNIPNPTYYSNNTISITNETTQGILALDALDNFKNAIIYINALAPLSVTAWNPDNLTSYITAQSFVSSLDSNYPANVLNDPTANTALKAKILESGVTEITPSTSPKTYTPSAQSLQNALNTMALNLATSANNESPSLAVEESSVIRKIINSLVSNVKKLFGRSADAAVTIAQAKVILDNARTVVDILPPRKLSSPIVRASLISAYQAPTPTWPSLNNESQLLSLKYHLYSALTEADVKIKRAEIVNEITALGTNASQDTIKALNDKTQALRDAITKAPSTSTYYIESDTVRNNAISKIDANLATIRGYKVTIGCVPPIAAETTYQWTSAETNGLYQVQYDGTNWKIASKNDLASTQQTIYNVSTTDDDFQCRYKCAPNFHEFQGMCISNFCQLPANEPIGQVNVVNVSKPLPVVNFGSKVVTGDTTSWAYNQEAGSLNTCEWSCPADSFKDPLSSGNVCLSECTNLCSAIKLSDTLIAAVQTAGGSLIESECTTNVQTPGCSIGEGNKVVTDYTCPSSSKKMATGCEMCPNGQVQDPNNSSICVPACANVCGNLTAVSLPANGATAVSTQCSTTASAVCNSSVVTDFTCGGGYVKYGGTCMFPYTSDLTKNGNRLKNTQDTANHACKDRTSAFNTGVVIDSSSGCYDVEYWGTTLLDWFGGWHTDTNDCGLFGSNNAYITTLYCY